MKNLAMVGLIAAVATAYAFAGNTGVKPKKETKPETVMQQQAIGDYRIIPFNTIDGSATNLKAFDGQIVLVVNVASECGHTPQYAGLESIYEKYKDQGLTIVGFPANNFGEQEPGSDAQIKEFCTSKFGIKFPMMSKVSVKGDDIHPLFKYLTQNSKIPGEIGWNFSKFLLDRNGNLIARWPSKIEPTSAEITGKIEELLKASKVEKKS